MTDEQKNEEEQQVPVVGRQIKTSGLLGGLGSLGGLLGNLGETFNRAMETAAEDGDGQMVVTQGGFTGSIGEWSAKHGGSEFKPKVYGTQKASPPKKEYAVPPPDLEMFEEEDRCVITGPCPGYSDGAFDYTVEDNVVTITARDYEQKFAPSKDLDWARRAIEVKNGLFLCTIPYVEDVNE